jgi:proteic killer suppression protein
MIRTFKHSSLKHYFETGDPKGLATEMVKRIQIRLNVLNRKGEYAIGVTGNYRMTFRFDAGDVLDLNLEDYH